MKLNFKATALTQMERPTFDIKHACPGCGKPPEEYRDSAGMPVLPGVPPVPDEDNVFCSGCAAQLGRENGWRVIAVLPETKRRGRAKAEDAPDA